jgi:hypothetical protein
MSKLKKVLANYENIEIFVEAENAEQEMNL